MTCKPLIPLFLVNSLFTVACSHTQPSESVSVTVIGSLLSADNPHEFDSLPWRLDSAWQGGDLGGSAFRAASIEHVIRQVEVPWSVTKSDVEDWNQSSHSLLNKRPDAEANPLNQTKANPSNPTPLFINRAWRKYCHHQLDMSPEEQAFITHTAIPFEILREGCYPKSLLK